MKREEKFKQEKEKSTVELIEATSAAPAIYAKVIDDRMSKVVALSKKLPDVDADGFVDRKELKMAERTNSGSAELNKFLDRNYSELQLLSLDLQNKTDGGISKSAIDLLSSKEHREQYFTAQNRYSAEQERNTFLRSASINTAVLASGTLALGLASRYLPAKVRPVCHLGVLLGAAAGIGGKTMYDTNETVEENTAFLDRQREAIKRVHKGL